MNDAVLPSILTVTSGAVFSLNQGVKKRQRQELIFASTSNRRIGRFDACLSERPE